MSWMLKTHVAQLLQRHRTGRGGVWGLGRPEGGQGLGSGDLRAYGWCSVLYGLLLALSCMQQAGLGVLYLGCIHPVSAAALQVVCVFWQVNMLNFIAAAAAAACSPGGLLRLAWCCVTRLPCTCWLLRWWTPSTSELLLRGDAHTLTRLPVVHGLVVQYAASLGPSCVKTNSSFPFGPCICM